MMTSMRLLISLWIRSTYTLTVVSVLILPTAQASQALNSTSSVRQQSTKQFLNATEKYATGVVEGEGKHVVYIYFDPNCPYCHKLFVELRTYVKKGGYTFHWVPVGILMASSQGKAAAILEARNPLAALRENEKNFSREDGFGSIPEVLMPSNKISRELNTNQELLARTGTEDVPTILFHRRDGTVADIIGAPPPEKLANVIQQVR